MNELFNTVLTNTSQDLSVGTAVVTIIVSLLFGAAIAFTYYKTQKAESYQRSLAVTLFMLPVILSVIIIFIGSNIARAFSLAGTLSIIRFRSAPGDAKDIGYIFFDIAAGLACGVGLFGYGALFVAVLCIMLVILERYSLFTPKNERRLLRIAVPEDLNINGVFDNILEEYTADYSLSKIKTTDLGSLFELVYVISMLPGVNEWEFINKLRTKNGNLTISLSEAPNSTK